MAKSTLPKSSKIAKKQFPEDFARKFNHENSFGSDNLVNDSKLETDSDESNLHQGTFDHKNFINSLAKKKNKRGNDYDSSSEISEKLESPKALAPIPLEDDEVDVDRFEDNIDEIQEEEETAPVVETKAKEPAAKPASSLFGNLNSVAPVVEKKSTENNTPSLKLGGGLGGGSLFSNLETKKETAPVTAPATEEAKPKTSLFSFGNNTETKKETTTAPATGGLFGGLTSTPAATTTETKPVEAKPASSGLFGGSTGGLFGGNNKQESPAAATPAVVEKTIPAEEPKPAVEEPTKPAEPKVEAPVHALFANINRQASLPQHSNNPFLSAASSQPKVDFSSLIGGGAAVNNENKPPVAVEAQVQNVETTMENNNNNMNNNVAPASEPLAGGFLGLISAKSNNGQNSMFSNTLKPTSNYSWMESNEEKPASNLFGGMSGGSGGLFGGNNNNNNNQSSMFTQNNPVNPFASGSQGGMNFEGGMGMGNNNNNSGMFGNNNNNDNNNPFGGGLSRQGSSMNNGLFGGNTGGGFQNNMFGGNSGGMDSNPFLQSQNSFGGGSGFGGGSSGNDLMRSNSTFAAGSAKKGKQKERAF